MPDTTAPLKHAFVSYVREDAKPIDKLCAVLAAAGILYWRDRNDLGPGDIWKAKIREAISGDSLAFLACFSTTSVNRDKSYQNEEIALAVEEFRQRPPGKTWLIPVRLDDCEVPDWDLGAGRTLKDVNYIDLFGDDYAQNAVRLVETAKKIMGVGVADAVTVRTAVNEAAEGERPAILTRLTKEMIREPAREIELDELITQEVVKLLAAMRDEERFSMTLSESTFDDQLLRLAEYAVDYWHLVKPFCASLQVAARWGKPETLSPWIKGIRALCAEAKRPAAGWDALIDLRSLCGLLAVMVAATASVGQDRWDNFRALLVDNTFPDPDRTGTRISVIESVSPWDPFQFNANEAAQILAYSAINGSDLATARGDSKTQGKRFTPESDWMHHILRPLFAEQYPDNSEYDGAFDDAEVALGIVQQDVGITRKGVDGQPVYFSNRWFGRSTWRYANRRCDPVKDLQDALEISGTGWKPTRDGLFGGSADRARAAISQYDEDFKKRARNRF